jgi:Tfp pilus assembly protein PilF
MSFIFKAGKAVMALAVVSAMACPWIGKGQPAPTSSAATEDKVTLLKEALQLRGQSNWDGAIAKISQFLQQDPQNMQAYVLRGDLYVKKKQWSQAEQDFVTAKKIDPQSSTARFDLAEIMLMQKKFDVARPGFRELEADKDLGDLATYKVFLCDLLGGHEDIAQRQLRSFDETGGSGASSYFAHVAWALFHNKPDEARSWLASAARIYTPQKN